MVDSNTLDKIVDVAEELLAMAPARSEDLTPELYERMRDKAAEFKPLKNDLDGGD